MAGRTPADAPSRVRVERSARAPRGWDMLVATDGSSDYPHTAHWNESVASTMPDAGAVWLTVAEEGRLTAGLVAIERRLGRGFLARHRMDSSFEGTSCGPLVAADLPRETQDVLVHELILAYARLRRGPLGAVTLALGPERETRFAHLLARDGRWHRHASPTAVIDLEGGPDEVAASRVSKPKRNERNRGLRAGAVVEVTDRADALDEYYPLYLAAAAQWGVVPTPLPFLKALLGDPAGRVFFTCVRVDGRIVGGHLNLHLGDRVFAWNGVTNPAVARSHFPSTLCLWGDIVEACRRGARWLDVGASGGITSLEGFKRYFGAESRARGYYVDEGGAVRAARSARALLRGPRPGRVGRGRPGQRWHDGRDGEPRPEGDH
ncbi:MAG: GNAT family N-acetyltransferase [bacterium]|nr:GNAT family N-acetyltransferase [bacterium]